jgi:hypothetical protein
MNTNNTTQYTNNTNIDMLLVASGTMIMDKYQININKNNLKDIIVKTVELISNDVSLINTKTLNELNKLTLIKIREFVESNIKKSNQQPSSAPSPKPISLEQQMPLNPQQDTQLPDTTLIHDDDLMNKMKSLEENRNAMNTLNAKGFNNNINYLHNDSDSNKTNNIEDIKLLLIDLIGTKTGDVTNTKETKQIAKKDLFINSINREWGFNKEINNLKLNIGIDIKNYYIEPHTILLPNYIKNDAPYIIVAFSDNNKSQNYNYIFNKNNGNWDEWININDTIETISIVSKNWKISFYDNRNNELHLYSDDIDIIEVIKDNNNFKLKLSDTYKYHKLKSNDFILIKTNDGKNHNKKIINIENEEITINDVGITIENFINSKIAIIKDQFTINLKYYPRY